jgi:hypothetical protein
MINVLLLSLALLCRNSFAGSTCADGWQSPSEGSGACSHHGGFAKDLAPPASLIWSKPPAYKSTYFDDQNKIIEACINRSREELRLAYNANIVYVENQMYLVKLLLSRLADMPHDSDDYDAMKVKVRNAQLDLGDAIERIRTVPTEEDARQLCASNGWR